MDNTPDDSATFDPSFFTPVNDAGKAALAQWQASLVPQNTSTPASSASASVDNWANQQIALGVPADQVSAQIGQKLREAGLRGVKSGQEDKSTDATTPDDPDFFTPVNDAGKTALAQWQSTLADSDITREQQQQAAGYSVPTYTDHVYNSPNADLAKPDAWQAPPTSVGDYLSSLAHAARAQAREWAGGLEQAAGEVPKAIAQDVTNAGNVLSSFTGPAQTAPYAFQQAVTQGAPAVNTPTLDATANIGRQQVAEAQQEQQQARGNLLPAPDDNTSALGKVGYYAQEAAVGAPTLLGALGAGPVGGAALFGLQSAGGAYAQKRDVENEDPETAASSAATEGAISALAGSIPLHAALNPESVNALKTVATTAGGGVAQSLLTEAGNMLSEQQNEGKHISYDEAVSRLKSAAAGGVIPGLILGAAGAASHTGVSPADKASAKVSEFANRIAGATPEESDAINAGVEMAKAAEPSDVVDTATDVAPEATAEDTQNGNESTQNVDAELQPASAKPSNQPEGLTPETISTIARDHVAQLESQDSLTPADEHDLAFLRQHVDNPQAIADHYGIPLAEPQQATLFSRSDDSANEQIAPDTSGIELQDLTPEQEDKLRGMLAEQQQAMAGRDNARLAGLSPDNFLHEAMTTLARNNESFASPRVSPETVSDAVDSAKLSATPDSIENEVDLEGNPYTAHNFRLPNGKTFTIKEYPDNWQIDVHKFDPGQGGNKLYNAMTGLAKTTGKPFIGDTSGLADWSILRRTENMASNGLKYGVNNVGPHERQLMPGGKMGWAKGLEWTPGNDKANQISLLKTAAENVHRLLPEIDQLRYNPTNDRLEHIDGTPVSADELGRLSQLAGERLAARGVRPHTSGAESDDAQANAGVGSDVGTKSGVPSKQGIPTPYGSTSIARAVLTRSLLSATGAGDRAAMLAALRAKLPESSVRRGIFYSRGDEATPNAGITPEQAKSEFAKRLSPMEARKLSAKIGMASSADLDNVATELSPVQRAGVRGYTVNGKPHVVLDHVTPDTVVPVAAHEAIHANLQKIIGYLGIHRVASAIRRLAATHPEIARALENVPKDTPAADMDQEVIAHAGEHLFDTSLKTRLLDSVKLGLNRIGFGRKWIDANDSLIRGMTRENLRHYALSDESPSFNVNGSRVGTNPLYHRAFHGSPHDFDQFDSSKIGTGEGAQAYGHGLYFAGKKEVADYYKNNLGNKWITVDGKRAQTLKGKSFSELLDVVRKLKPEANEVGDVKSLVRDYLRLGSWDAVRKENEGKVEYFRDRYDKLIDKYAHRIGQESKGRGYEVELAPQEHEYLDWDKPLSEQSPQVRQALTKVDSPMVKEMLQPMEASNTHGSAIYHAAKRDFGTSSYASKILHDAGIRGIRYLDGSSRNAGEGSHNYVIFNDKDVQIVKKYARTQYAAGGDGSQSANSESPFAQKLRAAMGQNRDGYTTDDKAGGTTGEPVGVKNAYKAQERQGRGLGELDAEGKRTFGNVWDTASEKLQSDPGYGARLTADVATKSRPLTAEETASMIQYGAGLKNRYEQALNDHDAAIKSGDGTAALGAKIRVKELEDLLGAHDQASRNAGYEQALGLSARRLMANRDYSLATQMMRFRAIEGGEVPQKVQAKVKEYAAKIADLQKQLDEQRARSHVSGYRRPPSVAPKQHFEDLRSRFAALAKEQPTGVRFAREDDMRAIVRGMAHSLVEDGETNAHNLVDRVHSALAEYGAKREDIARTIAGIGERAQHTKTELQLRLAAIKKELRAEFANPEAKRNATRQAQLRKQMDDLKRRIATGDFSKVTRQPIHYNEDTLGLEDERNKLQRKMDGLAIQRQRANASASEKLADFVVRLHRGLILTGVNTLGKLSWAALSRIALTPTEELIGSGLRQIPGISQIAAKAPREGAGFSLAAEKAALSHTLDRQQIISTLLHGEDSLARQYSNKAEYPFDWLNLAGHIHGMIKEPAKLNEFYRGFQQRAQFEYNRVISEGMTPAQADAHMQKPSTQATLGAQAYIDAKRAIFQNDTVATKMVAMIKHGLRNAGQEGDAGRALGIAAEKAIGFDMPIVKVPINFTAELGSYAMGGGFAKAGLALRHGIDSLTPDQADYVMRNLKKGTVGAVLTAVGMLAAPGTFTGFYQTGDAKRHRKSEEANIPALGGHFSRLWFDSPALDALQVGATLRRIYDHEAMRYGKPSAIGDAIYHAVGGMLEKVPFLDEPKRMFESFGTPKGAQKYLAGAARDTVIPLAVQQYAAHQDNDTARKTKTPLQVFQKGLPQTPLNPKFNRENLPRY